LRLGGGRLPSSARWTTRWTRRWTRGVSTGPAASAPPRAAFEAALTLVYPPTCVAW